MDLTTIPIIKPPAGQLPNFDAPNPLHTVILTTAILATIFTTIFTTARLVTKWLVASFHIEDYLLLAAWATSIAFNFTLVAGAGSGLGGHAYDTRASQFAHFSKYAWVLELIYFPPIWFAKAALLFQLIRIFTPMKTGAVYYACHILIWGNLAFYTASFFAIMFECHPIREVWNIFYGDHCVNRNLIAIVSGAVNVGSDLLSLILPIWAIWHLQMAPNRKAGLSAIFAIGILAFVSSICRLIFTVRISKGGSDVSFIIAQVGLWAIAEVSTIILCTCFPMLPRLVKLIYNRFCNQRSSQRKLFSPYSRAAVEKGRSSPLSSPYDDMGEDEDHTKPRINADRRYQSPETNPFGPEDSNNPSHRANLEMV